MTTTLTLPTSDPGGLNITEFDTRTLLAHAAEQSRANNYQDYFICDVDSHHYENESFGAIVKYIEDPVIRHQAQVSASRRSGAGFLGAPIGNQDQAGRVTRYHTRHMDSYPPGTQRDAHLTKKWMDAMGIDIAFLFPTPILTLASHPVQHLQNQYLRAYNAWLTQEILPAEPRLRSMLCLPFNDPVASYQMVEDFGDAAGVSGFMITASHNRPVHDNAYMKLYSALEERNLPLAFHGSYNWADTSFSTANKFITVHALGFVFHNMVHMANWIMNGLPERFPKLKVIWMESGLAWVPFMMQRFDNEYLMRSNEAPMLKMKPSEYMKRMYYSVQPLEIPEDLSILQTTFKMIDAETQLMYSSDYPHWDFDLPSVIYDLPFLSEAGKRNILGETARNVFNLGPLPKLAQIPAE
jgi:predicted TIM-barrel fold metal-dependent hydrolase